METKFLSLLSLSLIALLVLGFFGSSGMWGFEKYKYRGKMMNSRLNAAYVENTAGSGGMMNSGYRMMSNSRGYFWRVADVLGEKMLLERGGK